MKRAGERYRAPQFGYRSGIVNALERMQCDMADISVAGENRRILRNVDRTREQFRRSGIEADRLMIECGIGD